VKSLCYTGREGSLGSRGGHESRRRGRGGVGGEIADGCALSVLEGTPVRAFCFSGEAWPSMQV